MFRRLSLFLKRPIDANSRADPNDVVVVKRSLERLGYYQQPKWGLQDFTDGQMFEGIKAFQRDHGLRVDGIMRPGGETATALGPLLLQVEQKPHEADEEALNPDSRPPKERCDELYYHRDIPICNQVTAIFGAKRGAICQQSAALRYSMCLRGTPIHALPRLDDFGWGGDD